MRTIVRFITCLTLCWLTSPGIIFAQEKSPPHPAPSSSCSRDGALEIIQQQIALSTTIDNSVQRITVLIRAADLLWPFQQPRSRSAFSEAFDLATQNYKDKGDEPTRDGKLYISTPDQRYTVINALAKHDTSWARKLTDQMLKAEQLEEEDKPTKDTLRDTKTAEKLLTLAASLLTSDSQAALSFARSSLRYPATSYLPAFLYKLAGSNQPAANQLYQEALAAYTSAPMERLLYLASYPFGNDHEAGEMPGYTVYQVPGAFVPMQTCNECSCKRSCAARASSSIIHRKLWWAMNYPSPNKCGWR
jgi:hypothetical protein